MKEKQTAVDFNLNDFVIITSNRPDLKVANGKQARIIAIAELIPSTAQQWELLVILTETKESIYVAFADVVIIQSSLVNRKTAKDFDLGDLVEINSNHPVLKSLNGRRGKILDIVDSESPNKPIWELLIELIESDESKKCRQIYAGFVDVALISEL